MKRIYHIFALLVVLLATGACQLSKTERLKREIEVADDDCPIELGMMGSITGIAYDSELSLVDITIELSDVSVLNGLKANRNLSHKALLLSFSRGEAKKLLEMVAEAGAGIEFKFTTDSSNRSFTINLSHSDVRDAIENPLTEDEASRLLIETQVMMENARCPYSVGEGLTMTRVFDDGSSIVYCCTVDENIYDMDIMAKNLAGMKDNIGELFEDPVMNSQGALLSGQNKGFVYRYIGSRTGKMADIRFSPADIRRYCAE